MSFDNNVGRVLDGRLCRVESVDYSKGTDAIPLRCRCRSSA